MHQLPLRREDAAGRLREDQLPRAGLPQGEAGATEEGRLLRGLQRGRAEFGGKFKFHHGRRHQGGPPGPAALALRAPRAGPPRRLGLERPERAGVRLVRLRGRGDQVPSDGVPQGRLHRLRRPALQDLRRENLQLSGEEEETRR